MKGFAHSLGVTMLSINMLVISIIPPMVPQQNIAPFMPIQCFSYGRELRKGDIQEQPRDPSL